MPKEIRIILKENGRNSIRVYENDKPIESYLPNDDLTLISNVLSLMRGVEPEKTKVVNVGVRREHNDLLV